MYLYLGKCQYKDNEKRCMYYTNRYIFVLDVEYAWALRLISNSYFLYFGVMIPIYCITYVVKVIL